jgi:hypothetical protein
MPRKRNAVEIDGESALDVTTQSATATLPVIGYTPEAKSERRRLNTEIGQIRAGNLSSPMLRYEWQRDETGKLLCQASCCNRRFIDYATAVLHLSRPSFATRSCILCPEGSKFNWKSHRDFDLHIWSHLPPTFRCPEKGCSYITTHARYLKGHERVHNGYYQDENNLKHQCEQCDKKFALKADLKRHEETQESDRKTLTCKCGSAFFRPGDLRTHQRDSCKLRAVDAHHRCPECSLGFRSFDALSDHRLKAHAQRGQVLGYAASSGFLEAGVPSIMLAASTLVNNAVAVRFRQVKEDQDI